MDINMVTPARLAAAIVCIKTHQTVAFLVENSQQVKEAIDEFLQELEAFPQWFRPAYTQEGFKQIVTANGNKIIFRTQLSQLKGWTLGTVFAVPKYYDEVQRWVCNPYTKFVRIDV